MSKNIYFVYPITQDVLKQHLISLLPSKKLSKKEMSRKYKIYEAYNHYIKHSYHFPEVNVNSPYYRTYNPESRFNCFMIHVSLKGCKYSLHL